MTPPSADRRRQPGAAWLPVAMAAPVVVCGVLLLGVLLAGRAGVGPVAIPRPLTLSEAAATGDLGTVRWRLREGDDPNRMYAVDNDVVSIAPQVLPLEAGALSGDDTMVRLLQQAGATLSPEDTRRVACLMWSRSRTEVVRLIAGDRFDATACQVSAPGRPDVP